MFRIRIGFRFNYVSRTGSRQAKLSLKKVIKEEISCLKSLTPFIGFKKTCDGFWYKKTKKIFVLDPDSAKFLDLDSVNLDPKHWFILVCKLLSYSWNCTVCGMHYFALGAIKRNKLCWVTVQIRETLVLSLYLEARIRIRIKVTSRIRIRIKVIRIRKIFKNKNSKWSDPVSDKDPTWLKSSGSNRIRINNTGLWKRCNFVSLNWRNHVKLSKVVLRLFSWFFFLLN